MTMCVHTAVHLMYGFNDEAIHQVHSRMYRVVTVHGYKQARQTHEQVI